MLKFDVQRCLKDIQKADTADLIDRITAYRAGLEPEAVEQIEQELRRRRVPAAEIDARADECRRDCLFDETGTALTCSRCRKPAVAQATGAHWLWGLVPLFRRSLRYCKDHRPPSPSGAPGA